MMYATLAALDRLNCRLIVCAHQHIAAFGECQSPTGAVLGLFIVPVLNNAQRSCKSQSVVCRLKCGIGIGLLVSWLAVLYIPSTCMWWRLELDNSLDDLMKQPLSSVS